MRPHDGRKASVPKPVRHGRRDKQETREAILKHAAGRFRRDGIAAVGVRSLMAEAGLTHGGFYSHFASRADLVAATLGYAAQDTLGYFHAAIAAAPEDGKLEALLRAYLRPLHRDHPAFGCAVSALAPEIAREDVPTRGRFAARNQPIVHLIADHLPAGGSGEERIARASLVFAAMVGILQIMRIETDAAAAARLARAGRAAARDIAMAAWPDAGAEPDA